VTGMPIADRAQVAVRATASGCPDDDRPRIVVFSSLFPSDVQPNAGLFVRERVFRVGQRLPVTVVAPVPWFPMTKSIGRWRPGFRPGAPRYERQQSHDVWFPRFLSFPGAFKGLDGWLMALGAYRRMRALKREGRLDVIDAHFAYPDGYAAGLLGRWLGAPVVVTLRGTEQRHANDPALRPLLARAIERADTVIAVSESLRQIAISVGAPPEKVQVVGNGVDIEKFHRVPPSAARHALGLPEEVPVLVTVGGLVERKGFHRVMECLPDLRRDFPGLQYLVVGGAGPEGDWTDRLHRLRRTLGLDDCVHFLGPVAPAELHKVLSAADVFVLSTRNEGWANVLLEAMACGLPVVATDVGGNKEVVCMPELGEIVPFADPSSLTDAIARALRKRWDRSFIRRYAEENTWDKRVQILDARFRSLHADPTVDARTPVGSRKS
jgi:teichuronic acid biosynthesis glycosyltransferase TuaC